MEAGEKGRGERRRKGGRKEERRGREEMKMRGKEEGREGERVGKDVLLHK